MKRRRIHSSLKLLEAAGKLPVEYRVTIHRSQLWRYRKMAKRDFYGSELVVYNEQQLTVNRLSEYPILEMIVALMIKALDIIQLIVFTGAIRFMIAEEKFQSYLTNKITAFFIALSQEDAIERTKPKKSVLVEEPAQPTITPREITGLSDSMEVYEHRECRIDSS